MEADARRRSADQTAVLPALPVAVAHSIVLCRERHHGRCHTNWLAQGSTYVRSLQHREHELQPNHQSLAPDYNCPMVDCSAAKIRALPAMQPQYLPSMAHTAVRNALSRGLRLQMRVEGEISAYC